MKVYRSDSERRLLLYRKRLEVPVTVGIRWNQQRTTWTVTVRELVRFVNWQGISCRLIYLWEPTPYGICRELEHDRQELGFVVFEIGLTNQGTVCSLCPFHSIPNAGHMAKAMRTGDFQLTLVLVLDLLLAIIKRKDKPMLEELKTKEFSQRCPSPK